MSAINAFSEELDSACRRGHTSRVKQLIENGADVNAHYGSTPLHRAAKFGHINCVMELLSHGAALEARDRKGYTALFMAIMHTHISIAQCLILNGANINAADYKGHTNLHIAALRGKLECVKLLLKNGADWTLRTTDQGVSPLMAACLGCHDEVIEYLLQNGVPPESGALKCALQENSNSACLLLLKYGASVNDYNDRGLCALMSVIMARKREMMALLIIHGADVDFVSYKHQETPLHLAAQHCFPEGLQLLLDHKAKVNVQMSDGTTPLMHAVAQQSRECVEILILHGADVNMKRNNGDTALHAAALKGDKYIVEVLLESKADPDSFDNKGATPLHCACQNGHVACVKKLVKHGASKNKDSYHGITPLQLAIRWEHSEVVKYLISGSESEIVAVPHPGSDVTPVAKKEEPVANPTDPKHDKNKEAEFISFEIDKKIIDMKGIAESYLSSSTSDIKHESSLTTAYSKHLTSALKMSMNLEDKTHSSDPMHIETTADYPAQLLESDLTESLSVTRMMTMFEDNPDYKEVWESFKKTYIDNVE